MSHRLSISSRRNRLWYRLRMSLRRSHHQMDLFLIFGPCSSLIRCSTWRWLTTCIGSTIDHRTTRRMSQKRGTRYQQKLQVQMKTNVFDPGDSISILSFRARYKQACDSNWIYKCDAIWCVKHFFTKSAATSPAFCLSLKNRKTSDKPEDMLSSRKEIVKHLLETPTADYVIAKTEMRMQDAKQP